MNYADLLIDYQKSGVSALLTFVLEYRNFDKAVACFIEGKDFPYYSSRVCDNVDSDNEVLFYSCNGKKEVELVKKMIDSNLNLKDGVKTLYFCDSDYELDDKIDGIYYTDYYSVENFYTNREFIEKVILNVFNINRYNPNYNVCLNFFDKNYQIYKKQSKKLNAYCYALRSNEKKYLMPRTILKDSIYDKLILDNRVDNFQVSNIDYEFISSIISSEVDVSKDEYTFFLDKIDDTKLRGKWELRFIIWFLESIRKEIKNGNCGFVKNNYKVISFDNEIITSMREYALTTCNLIDYIKFHVK